LMTLREKFDILAYPAPGSPFTGCPVKGKPDLQRHSDLLSAESMLVSTTSLLFLVYVDSHCVKLKKILIWEAKKVVSGIASVALGALGNR
jgi:hypothetical protein